MKKALALFVFLILLVPSLANAQIFNRSANPPETPDQPPVVGPTQPNPDDFQYAPLPQEDPYTAPTPDFNSNINDSLNINLDNSNINFDGGSGFKAGTFREAMVSIVSLINTVLIPIIFAISFVAFLYFVFKYFILGATNEAERKKGLPYVLWSLLALFVMISVWGLVQLLLNTFGF